jgi:hypothetical protein
MGHQEIKKGDIRYPKSKQEKQHWGDWQLLSEVLDRLLKGEI